MDKVNFDSVIKGILNQNGGSKRKSNEVPILMTITPDNAENLVKSYADVLSWEWISSFIDINMFSYEFVHNFKNEFDWMMISEHQNLTDEFIIEFKDLIDFDTLLSYQKLMKEDTVRAFLDKDKISWFLVSCMYNISESFIVEFSDKIPWSCLGRQDFSFDFIKEHKGKLKRSRLISGIHSRYCAGLCTQEYWLLFAKKISELYPEKTCECDNISSCFECKDL